MFGKITAKAYDYQPLQGQEMINQTKINNPKQPTLEEGLDQEKQPTPEKDLEQEKTPDKEKVKSELNTDIKNIIQKIRNLDEKNRSGVDDFLLAVHDYKAKGESLSNDDEKIIETTYNNILKDLISLEKLKARQRTISERIPTRFSSLLARKGNYFKKINEIKDIASNN